MLYVFAIDDLFYFTADDVSIDPVGPFETYEEAWETLVEFEEE